MWKISFIQSPYSELKIIVAVFQLILIRLYYSACPVFLAGLDVVILDEAIVIVFQLSLILSHSAGDTAGERRVLPAELAHAVRLSQQGVSVTGQETVKETELQNHHDEQWEGEDCTHSDDYVRKIHSLLALGRFGPQN